MIVLLTSIHTHFHVFIFMVFVSLFVSYLMQKVEDIKVNYKQCQDVLDCAEKRLQTNGLGVTTEGESSFNQNKS